MDARDRFAIIGISCALVFVPLGVALTWTVGVAAIVLGVLCGALGIALAFPAPGEPSNTVELADETEPEAPPTFTRTGPFPRPVGMTGSE